MKKIKKKKPPKNKENKVKKVSIQEFDSVMRKILSAPPQPKKKTRKSK